MQVQEKNATGKRARIFDRARIAGNIVNGTGKASMLPNALLASSVEGTLTGRNLEDSLFDGAEGYGAGKAIGYLGGKIASNTGRYGNALLDALDPVGKKARAAKRLKNELSGEEHPTLVDEGPYQAVIDKLAAQDGKIDRAYKDSDWNMSEEGHDFRKDTPLARPLYLGDMEHPAQAGKRMPIVLKQGRQDITDPKGSGEGLDHIEFRHGALLRKRGFENGSAYLRHIVENGNVLVHQPNGKYALIFKNEGTSSNSLHDQAILEFADEGDHFSVKTAFPANYRSLKKAEEFKNGDAARVIVNPSQYLSDRDTGLFPNSGGKTGAAGRPSDRGPRPDPEDNPEPEGVKPVYDEPTAEQAKARAKAARISPLTGEKKAPDIASHILTAFAQGGNIRRVPSSIPGVKLTYAQETGNAGLANLENAVRDEHANAFDEIEKANDEARQAYLRQITGTEDALKKAEATREAFERRAHQEAFAHEQPVPARHLHDALYKTWQDNLGNDSVQRPLSRAMDNLKQVIDEQTGTALPSHLLFWGSDRSKYNRIVKAIQLTPPP